MLEQEYYDKADEIVASHGRTQADLIPIIQDIQEEYRYLPPELTYVAEKLDIYESQAYSVATFYENFFFSIRRESILSKSATDGLSRPQIHSYSGDPFTPSWAFPRRSTPQKICFSPSKPFPAWVRAVSRR